MGGVCKLVTAMKKINGPPCTDNFQVVTLKFKHGGFEWWSAEQAYQASKFSKKNSLFRAIRDANPDGESDWDFGMRVWRMGQEKAPRTTWNEEKLRIMLLVNISKFQSLQRLRDELRATAYHNIEGAPSTWNWQLYNGQIMTVIRETIMNGCLTKLASSVTGMSHSEIEKFLSTLGLIEQLKCPGERPAYGSRNSHMMDAEGFSEMFREMHRNNTSGYGFNP